MNVSLIVLLLSLACAWLCTGIRSALMSVERTRVEDAAEKGSTRAQLLLRLLDNPFRSLAPINFIYVASLIALALALTWNAFETTQELFPRLSEIVLVLIILFIGKTIIDLIAISRDLSIALLLARPLSWLDALASPFLKSNEWLARVAKGPRIRRRTTDRVSSDDIQIIMAEDGGETRKIELIDPDEREMIAGIIEMGQRYASEIMIPRPDVVALDVKATIEDALQVAIQHGHSRLPAYEEDIDHIVGILHVKDLLPAMQHPHQEVLLPELLRPVHYVPETERADNILRDLLRNRVHMAVVVDEYGGTSGILTIEDVIEEIVGEIRDEYDTAEEAPFTRISDQEALFNGSVSVSEFNEEFQVELPTEESDTLGGLIYARLGRLPRQGDHVRVGNVELTVTRLSGRRIQQVHALKILEEEPEAVKSNGSEKSSE